MLLQDLEIRIGNIDIGVLGLVRITVNEHCGTTVSITGNDVKVVECAKILKGRYLTLQRIVAGYTAIDEVYIIYKDPLIVKELAE